MLVKDHVGVTKPKKTLAGRSRRGNGNDGYCDARPQAMRELR